MVQKKSMTDVAYKLLQDKKEKLSFEQLWSGITKELAFTEDQARARIASFYTQLIIDGRFVTLGENVWDLRERCTFDKVHIDMNDVYVEDDDEEIEIDDEVEEDEVVEDEEIDGDEEKEVDEEY